MDYDDIKSMLIILTVILVGVFSFVGLASRNVVKSMEEACPLEYISDGIHRTWINNRCYTDEQLERYYEMEG